MCVDKIRDSMNDIECVIKAKFKARYNLVDLHELVTANHKLNTATANIEILHQANEDSQSNNMYLYEKNNNLMSELRKNTITKDALQQDNFNLTCSVQALYERNDTHLTGLVVSFILNLFLIGLLVYERLN